MARRRSKKSGGPTLSYINHEKSFNVNILYQVLQWVFLVFIAVFLGIAVIYAFGIRASVVGDSMEPALSNGQEVLINKIAYQFSAPKQGDVIVFRPNGNENAHLSVKRVDNNGNRDTKFLKDVFRFGLNIILHAGADSCVFHSSTTFR